MESYVLCKITKILIYYGSDFSFRSIQGVRLKIKGENSRISVIFDDDVIDY